MSEPDVKSDALLWQKLVNDGMLTAALIAKYTGMSQQTAYRRIGDGGMSICEMKALITHHPDPRVAARIGDWLCEHCTMVMYQDTDAADVLDVDVNGAMEHMKQAGETVLQLMADTHTALADDGKIDSIEASGLDAAVTKLIRSGFEFKAIVNHHGQLHQRRQARPLKPAAGDGTSLSLAGDD